MSLCSPDIKAYFQLDIDKTKEKKSPRFRQQLRADEAARTHFGDDEYEDELKAALHQSRVEHEFSERAGARYDRGGGSSSQRVSRGALDRMMGRSREQVPERVRDYNLAQASGLRQQRIDTGPWTSKGRSSKEILGRAWAKACHAIGIPGRKEIKNVLKIIDPENVVQIVTDNGSNFKKACKMLSRETIEYKHIVWQPCLAHTINLMLKDIGKWAHHEAMIQSAQRICSWMYNSSSLHSMMKKAIRGELVKWNATRFGTNCMFLESFMRRKDKFMVWFMSPEFRHSRYFLTEMGRYAFDNITNVEWWENMQYVLDEVEPLYVFLRFADQEKSPTLDLRKGVERMFDSNTAAMTLQEYDFFKRKIGDFSSELARRMAVDRGTSPSSWWSMFGSDTPTLQRVAKRLLSQCVSSSGCERNWSTFAFIHTKLRNKLGYLKLHELVFVNYNLRLRIQRATGTPEPSKFDPALAFMDLSLHRHNEAIRDWMERGRSNAPPTLDEDSPISDTPLPSTLFTSLVREQGGTEEVQEWADETIGDTHLGKRKTRLSPSDRKGKRVKITDQIEEEEEDEDSDDNTTDPSAGDDGSHGDAGLYGVGGSGAGGSGTGGNGAGDWRSTGGGRFTHSTQDSYHDAPYSQRETISGRRRSVSFLVQDGIRSSSSSGSSNYPTGQDPVYNPYAWQWQPSQQTYGPPPPSGEAPPSIMYGYGNYGPPPPPYSNLSNMYPPGPQYGYGQVPAAPTYHYQYDGLDQYHDPSNMPEYYHYDSS
ncbi:hypothetical protein ZEAMMB73_Zm00001d022404 [Zea mays]|uniref:HAT transposon superfamily protein n=2 Tax=Zea mays TaxID=4577 RepID=A0A1D6IM76_MAIZE|nr:hypothetical protein ZEAMMB73_Zm00001d022404 [Zea mays]